MSRVFGKVCQNGYVIRDIEAAMHHWITVMGVGPWFYIEDVKTDWFRHRGKDSDAKMSIALANSGDLQIELIQPRNDAPSMYREFLDAGHEGLQHMSYWTEDYQGLYDKALALGYRVGHEGCIGGEKGRFAYFDTEAHPGTDADAYTTPGATVEHDEGDRHRAHLPAHRRSPSGPREDRSQRQQRHVGSGSSGPLARQRPRRRVHRPGRRHEEPRRRLLPVETDRP